MESKLLPHEHKQQDEFYLKIWEIGHTHTNTRWSNTTFFLTVSFAIFGFSFQADRSPVSQTLIVAQRIAAVAIYWFAFLLFLRFNDYSEFVRAYLREMEESGKVTIDLGSKARSFMSSRKRPTSPRLLFYFGLVYTVGMVATWFLR